MRTLRSVLASILMCRLCVQCPASRAVLSHLKAGDGTECASKDDRRPQCRVERLWEESRSNGGKHASSEM